VSVAKPSLRALIITNLVRLIVKRWPRKNLDATVRRSRFVFNAPALFSFLFTHGVTVRETDHGEWLTPDHLRDQQSVIFYFHGGGYVSCSPSTHRAITANLARLTGQRIFALDYRLAPEHPFPAAIDDAEAAYDWLLRDHGLSPHRITFAGDSAGGGMVIALMLRLRSHDKPLPAGAVCFSPWFDMTGSCDYRNAESCAMFRTGDVEAFATLYLGNSSAENPEASPLFGDLGGLPPVLIQASSTELLLDDAQRFHAKALASGVRAHLSVYPALPHVWQITVGIMPESRRALEEAAHFITANVQVSTEMPHSRIEAAGCSVHKL
jgi:epsilon-lactone hydrolase